MAKPLQVNINRKELPTSKNGNLVVLETITMTIESGQFISILGPSGCGKTTLLRLILGLDNDYEGSIKLDGEVIRGAGLDRGAVFQEPRLLPWLSALGNVEFAIPDGRRDKSALARARELIGLVGLDGFETAWPNQLSGGMAQRTALARALVNTPDVLLMDEPFGALDGYTRVTMQNELLRILQREGTTSLLITHDVDEAVFLSDRILVLSKRPASVRAEFAVSMTKPRDRMLPEFREMRSKVVEAFYGE